MGREQKFHCKEIKGGKVSVPAFRRGGGGGKIYCIEAEGERGLIYWIFHIFGRGDGHGWGEG